MTKKIKVAVIGVGYLGNYHSEKYAKHPSVDLVGVVDTRPERGQSIAARLGTTFYSHVTEIIDKVQAVSVVVPTDQHYDVTKICLEAGLDVLVEKPFTKESWQAEELLALAVKNHCILQVGHLERFNPVVKEAHKFLCAPLFIECHRLNSFVDRGTEVDIVLDLMIHDLDILLNIVPFPVVRIDAIGAPIVSSNIDIANVRLQFQSGCVANLTASRISFKPMRKMRIFQRDAYLSLDFQHSTVDVFRKISGDNALLPEIRGEQFSFEKSDPLQDEIFSFINAVDLRTKPIVTAESALEALTLAEQIVKSIKHTAKQYYPEFSDHLPTLYL